MSAYAHKASSHVSERALQKEIVAWLRSCNILVTSTCGGVAYLPHQRKMLYETGYLKGIPDLIVLHAAGPFHAMFIEVKTPAGRLSREQKQVSALLTNNGYLWVVARSLDDVKQIVALYFAADSGQTPGDADKVLGADSDEVVSSEGQKPGLGDSVGV